MITSNHRNTAHGNFLKLSITFKSLYGWKAVTAVCYPRKILSVTVPISSDEKISSDEDIDVRRRPVNSIANSIVHESTESSY